MRMEEDRYLDRLWTYEDLATRWEVSPRQARRIVDVLGVRAVRLGNRTVRFRPCAVLAAEERRERGRR